MTEPDTATLAQPHPPDAAPTAGSTLRRAREDAGLHIAALAVALKVPVKKLEALESDRLDLLPDAVFARALAASVCRTLKLEPDPVLRLLPQHNAPRLQADTRLADATVRASGMGWGLPMVSRLPRPIVVVAALLLLAAAALWFFPALQLRQDAPEPATVDAAPSLAGQVLTEVPSAAASASDMVASAAPAVGVAATLEQQPPAAAPVEAPASAVPAVSLVVFKARGASWVEARDAGGVTLLRRTLAAGETVSASGALPLSVVVGRADAVDVVVRGSTFDTARVSKDNVARFQIN